LTGKGPSFTVLAAALEAAPIELLYPIGYGDDVEILPGRFLDSACRGAVVLR
jgi:hypothetical protein